MTEAEWLACEDPTPMLRFLTDTASNRKVRLFSCACARACEHYWIRNQPWDGQLEADLADLRLAIDAGEDMADGVPVMLSSDSEEWYVIDKDAQYGAFQTLKEVTQLGSKPLELLRDIFGNPFRPVTFPPEWRTDAAVALARQMYEARDFSAMPILADALQDAGCDNDDILDHCRGDGPHVRGCWVVDLVLGKV
jgi:hypothetical protein